MSEQTERIKYLRLLAEQFPSLEAICTEITRLGALLSLPKSTEHFMSDIHGEYEAFCHIMNNCSGVIREKVGQWLGDQLTPAEADALCTLIYYPDTILKQLHAQGELTTDWYRAQVGHMTLLARLMSTKYTRDVVRAAMPEGWAFVLDELLHFQGDVEEEHSEQADIQLRYYQTIIDTMIAIHSGDEIIIALAALIKRLAVARLHVVGDIFDRGPRADSIMDILMRHHAVDIEWGNHDILWMGAASGSEVCVAGVVRNALAYGNMEILERGYGIPLRELTLLAEKLYPGEALERAALHAITIMMFKLEGQLIRRRPEFSMDDRLLLHRMDRQRGVIEIDGVEWPLVRTPVPTLSQEDPYMLTDDEIAVMAGLRAAFRHSARLHEHISFLYRRGRMYRAYNGNLIFHGCVPLAEDGSFLRKRLEGGEYSGRGFMDYCDKVARRAFYQGDRYALDFMWYLWCGTDSPVCGRSIKTFARAFIADERAWQEPRNAYYTWYLSEEKCVEILAEFGLNAPDSRIINGHTPVRVSHGESPVKANGRLIVIDGGFCRAYQKTTGIAGYTLISNSHGMRIIAHQPFTSLRDAWKNGTDIHSRSYKFASYPHRRYVADTDHGKRLRERMDDLIALLEACRAGVVPLAN